MTKYSPVIENYFQNVIKKSWTWSRLTEEEKRRFTELNFDVIKGIDVTRVEWFNCMYKSFLAALGYEPIGWRETEDVPKF